MQVHFASGTLVVCVEGPGDADAVVCRLEEMGFPGASPVALEGLRVTQGRRRKLMSSRILLLPSWSGWKEQLASMGEVLSVWHLPDTDQILVHLEVGTSAAPQLPGESVWWVLCPPLRCGLVS